MDRIKELILTKEYIDFKISRLLVWTELEYFIDDDNTDTVVLPIKLNWEMAVTEEEKGMGGVSIGDEVDIELVNDAQGNLMVKEIKVPVYTL
jgi:hypothetical protein